MIDKLVQTLQSYSQELTFCSNREIESLEKLYGFTLPGTYKQFLREMGHDAGEFMRGSTFDYGDLNDINEAAHELVKENNFLPLPSNAFVFWMHQGYQFVFFKIGEGDDPPVYYYNENMDHKDFVVLNPSLSRFYEKALQSFVEYRKAK